MSTYPNAFDVECRDWRVPAKNYHETVGKRNEAEDALNIAWVLRAFSKDTAMLSYMNRDWRTCHEWAVLAAKECKYFLLGDWRQRQVTSTGVVNADSWFKGSKSQESWVIYIEDALGWATVGRAWSEASQLLEFPQESIGIDPDGPAARAYYLGLAPWWRDRQDTSGLDEAKQVRGAGSKRYHLQCDIALAISERDESQLQKAFPKAVQHFLKRRDHNEQFPMAATFLWHVAKKDGLEVELEPEVGKFLFQLPDSYWAEKDN